MLLLVWVLMAALVMGAVQIPRSIRNQRLLIEILQEENPSTALTFLSTHLSAFHFESLAYYIPRIINERAFKLLDTVMHDEFRCQQFINDKKYVDVRRRTFQMSLNRFSSLIREGLLDAKALIGLFQDYSWSLQPLPEGPFSSLTDLILQHLASLMSGQDLLNLSQTCWKMKSILSPRVHANSHQYVQNVVWRL